MIIPHAHYTHLPSSKERAKERSKNYREGGEGKKAQKNAQKTQKNIKRR
jgi:hypothetical protein